MEVLEIADVPSTADCGKLIMGVPYSEPKTPPLELFKCQSKRFGIHAGRKHEHSESSAGHILESQLPISRLDQKVNIKLRNDVMVIPSSLGQRSPFRPQ